MYYINPDECIECGACEPECPVNAIFHESAVPEEWQSYTQKNRELSVLLSGPGSLKTTKITQYGCSRSAASCGPNAWTQRSTVRLDTSMPARPAAPSRS